MAIGASVIGALRVVLGMDVAQFEEGSKRAGSSMDKLAKKAESVGRAIGAAFMASRLRSFVNEAVTAFGIQENAIAAVEAAVKQTGGTAGFTTEQLAKMAAGLQKISTYGDEEILDKVTANMLTFGNIVGPVFEEAQKAAIDLSARLKQDLQSSTIQLGKALNDPIKGITALQRVGVAFTESQKDQIKQLVASNKVMEAQKLILTELGKEFGGQAEAIAQTTGGKLKQAANAFGDAMEHVGRALDPIVRPLAEWIKSLSEGFQGLSPQVQQFAVAFVGLGAAITVASLAAAAATAVFGAIAFPIVAVVGAISAVTAALYAWGPNVLRVASAIGGYFYSIYADAKKWLYDALKPIIEKVSEWFTWLGEKVAWLADKLSLSDAAEEVKSSAVKMAEGLEPYKKRLSDLWYGTEELKKSTSSITAPVMKIPEGYDPAGTAKAQAELNKAISEGVNIVKKNQSPWVKYTHQMESLNAALKAGKISADEFSVAQKLMFEEANLAYEGGAELVAKYRTPYEQMQATLERLNLQYQQGAISAQALGRAQEQATLVATGAYVDMASSIAGNLSQVFKKSKAIAIATGTIDAIASALKALSAYPPPFSYVAAAAALAAGMAKVAAIKSTSENSGGSAGGATAASAGGAGATAAAQPKQAVTINLHGDRYGPDQVRALIGQINAAVADGAVLRVA